MTWVRFDDLTDEHPKVAALSDRGFRWWFRSLCYASRYLTDGALPAAFLMRVPAKATEELKAAGLWKLVDDVLTIHDYLVYQPSRASVTEKRKKVADKVRNWRRNPDSNHASNPVSNPVTGVVSNPVSNPAPVPSRPKKIKEHSPSAVAGESPDESLSHPIKALLTYRDELFVRVNHGAKPPKPTKADMKAAKDFIAEHGYERARLIVRQAFVTRDKFIAESGRSMAFIASSTAQNKLIAELAQTQRQAEPVERPASLRLIDEMEARRVG